MFAFFKHYNKMMNAFDMIYRLEMNKERISEHEEMSGPYKLCKFKIKEKKMKMEQNIKEL